jgi:hypothetical protein
MISIAIAILVGVAGAWYSDVYQWNGGISRKSGLPWKHFDTDSQGGRMYSDGANDRCDISYPFVDSNYPKALEAAQLQAEVELLRQKVKDYEENITYLLDRTTNAVRSKYKYGAESLVDSLCINYIDLRDAAGRRKHVD